MSKVGISDRYHSSDDPVDEPVDYGRTAASGSIKIIRFVSIKIIPLGFFIVILVSSREVLAV
jgi:hypothetical protein